MKTTYNILAALILTFAISVNATAQKVAPPYSIGLRANPDGGGVTAKYFFNENINIEAMLNGSGGTSSHGYHSTVFLGLVEYNFLLSNPAWRVFVGPGVHIGGQKQYRYLYGEYPDANQAIFGFDMIGGVEYLFDYVPIGISLDIKPTVNVSVYNGITAFPNNTCGLGVRYYFVSWAGRGYRADVIEAGR